MNSVSLLGRLTRDPELQYTQQGKAYMRFIVAVNRMGEGADFINCTAWEKTAETIADYFKKGQRILVQGSIRTGSYDKNGETVYTTDVMVYRIEFIETNNSRDENNNSQTRKQKSQKDDIDMEEPFPF